MPGQFLPVHAYPSGDWAGRHVDGASHGKAEAWYVLAPGEVYLGLRGDVGAEELMEVVRSLEVGTLLERMHRFGVRPHQTVYVPPGVLHAIGEARLVLPSWWP